MPVDWLPSPADVAKYVRTRTKDKFGHELSTFNEHTRPTEEDVLQLIDASVARIVGKVKEIPELLQPQARYVAALGAACVVEKTIVPEQVATGRSPYKELKAEYDEEFKDLIQSAGIINDGGQPGDVSVSNPAYGFPDCGMVGLYTRF